MIQKYTIRIGEVVMLGQLIMSIFLLVCTSKIQSVDMTLFYWTFAMSMFSMVTYFHYKRKNNYLDFDTIFVSVGYLICFFSTFFYNQPFYNALFLGFRFNESYINYATIVALIGFQAYFIGSLSCKKRIIHRPPLKIINSRILTIVILFGLGMFMMMGGLSYYRSIYASIDGSSSHYVTHILLLVCIFSIVLIATEFYNMQVNHAYKPSKLSIIVICVFSLLLMFVGNRTAASQILLPLLGLYAAFYRRLRIREFFIFLLIGIIAMWLFQNIRSDRSINISAQNVVLILSDLTIPSRANFVAAEYVDDNGYTMGENMLGGVVGIVPFLTSALSLDMDRLSSAELLTKETHSNLNTPKSAQVGLGTTIIADIYLSFGVLGVIVLMFFLGSIVSRIQQNTLMLDYYSVIVYSAFLANSVFVARASFTHPVRYIVLSLIVAIITRNISNKQAIRS